MMKKKEIIRMMKKKEIIRMMKKKRMMKKREIRDRVYTNTPSSFMEDVGKLTFRREFKSECKRERSLKKNE